MNISKGIRFRIWDKHRQEMGKPDTVESLMIQGMYASMTASHKEGGWAPSEGEKGGIEEFVNSQLVFMLSTKLFDTNGVEIFEGDIVKFESHIADIYYHTSPFSACFVPREKKGESVFEDYMGPKFSWDELEVIGNIYQMEI